MAQGAGDVYSVVGRNAATPASPSTIVMVTAGATKRCWLLSMEIGSTNAAAIAGADISVGRPTTAGTGGAAYTPLPEDPAAPAAIFTALSSSTVWSAEPTQPTTWDYRAGVDVLTTLFWVPPVPLVIPLNGRLAVRVEADGSATKVQWTCTLRIQE